MANALIHETSPYLLQHAHNPVNWYPWGEEAMARAKAEGKKLGRPTNVNVNTGVAVKLLREKGASIHSIAKQLRIGVSTTTRLLAA